ncbi:rod shape-determining protein RodA [Desulfonatronospira sp.]|uniref:rod shape-determining protein RodA n=1 Tax=Desulfonatronospira sp. TaxID=1962951 RepID=UPI0025B95162|nr:rod shape-determining protein RodA [Desulfonatronospira sp.]
MIDRQLVLHINWYLLGLTVLLFAAGVLNLYSASAFRLSEGTTLNNFYSRQLVWGCAGLLAMLLFMIIDYRHFRFLSWYIYIVSLVLLACVFFWGVSIYGAQRWLSLGFVSFQPSELVKVGVIILTAHVLSNNEHPLKLKDLIKVLIIAIIPVVIVARQPDLGSALVILFILGGIIVYQGIDRKIVKILLVLLPMLAPLFWFLLQDYQKTRLLSFINPAQDPLGSGYHVIQSQIAVGSGGFWGKGFMEGTQSQLRFLPEKHTDFAFSVFGEEWGFLGALVLLIIFCAFLYQVLSASQEAKDRFGSLLCVGVFFYFFLQIMVNMGMVLGLLPVVGIPLPFISYGGTSAMVNFIMVGLVINVSMRRYLFKS